MKKAIKLFKINLVITFPNADPKNKKIIEFLKKILKTKRNIFLLKIVEKELYINLLKHSEFIIGNSSSGIVEAASLKLPAINIGSRQDGKFKPLNVIDCDYQTKNIIRSIKKLKA